jgi:predicted hotdog family 3-hydroxylacyl-ACP dehydratase
MTVTDAEAPDTAGAEGDETDGDAMPTVGELVPHRPPMLLVDRVIAHGDNVIVCEVEVKADSLFTIERDGRREVPAVVGIEYMAQTVATFAGLSARKERRAPRIGFLIGCRELRLDTDAFAADDVLRVEARRLFGENDVGSFACTITRGGRTLVTGTLTVYQGPLPEEMGT